MRTATVHVLGCILESHEAVDAAAVAAYGWAVDISDAEAVLRESPALDGGDP